MFTQHNDLKIHFEIFYLIQAFAKQNLMWKDLWVAVVWSIWDHKNKVVFQQGKVDLEEVLYMAQLKVWLSLNTKCMLLIFLIRTGY